VLLNYWAGLQGIRFIEKLIRAIRQAIQQSPTIFMCEIRRNSPRFGRHIG
jgi:hypothetical protein